MGRVWDSFPEAAKSKYLDQKLRPGTVLYLHCEFTLPQPKDKFVLLASLGTPPLLFVVNSAINQYIQSRPHLLSCQVVLQASEYSFLSQDSYLNCSEVITGVPEESIRGQLMSDTGRLKGDLSQATKQRIVEVVCRARTISPRHKKRILRALG